MPDEDNSFGGSLSLVLICRRRTWDIAADTAWDNAAEYVNIYRRHIIYPRHWPPACLRSWAEFNFAGKPAAVCHYRRWKYFMWTSSEVATCSRRTIPSIFRVKMVKNCAIRLAFRANFSTLAIHLQMQRVPTGTDRRTLSVATGDYLTGRSARYENQA